MEARRHNKIDEDCSVPDSVSRPQTILPQRVVYQHYVQETRASGGLLLLCDRSTSLESSQQPGKRLRDAACDLEVLEHTRFPEHFLHWLGLCMIHLQKAE